MPNQKVKFVTGFGSFGGSTLALIEHCRLLAENGFDVSLYGDGDWYMDKFEGSMRMSELSVDSDDIVVVHHKDLDVRPRCKRCILYLHEKFLWPLDGRNLLPFDSIAYVSEDQMAFHGKPGRVVPNPVSRMVDPARHSPPNANIAGVVGTIQSRKRQHVSVERALADGRDRVLLFGDFEARYFDEYIRPILSDKVVYMGICDPSDRMRMYNSFDHLYMFSSDESASLVLGECRLLGKQVFKSDEIKEYEIVPDEKILSIWKELFSEVSPVIGEFRSGGSEDCERLVCVVTHRRKSFISKWLRAWNNSDRCGAKLAVLHACDGSRPDESEMKNILRHKPDFYIPFKNDSLRDMRALHLVLRDAAGLPDWGSLFWFTDDMMPMRSDFLKPFVEKLTGDVGLVAQCYEPRHDLYEETPGNGCLPHIRTVAYALTREASDALTFPSVGSEGDRPYLFEHGRVGLYEDHILRQITKNGFGFALCHSEPGNYVHWTQSLDWMWDCHLFSEGAVVDGKKLSSRQMWELYESQFSYSAETDPILIFTPEQCENKSLKSGKISAIIPSFSSPMNCFMWSVFSLLLRSDPNVLDHIFFSLNGPDSREGGNELQDKKQAFLEDLRGCSWPGRGFNPGAMTISRTWSRVGHAQALEQSIPWVDTEFYLSMHDDVLVVDPSWCNLSDFSTNSKMVLKTWGNPLMCTMRPVGSRLEMPHMNTIFTLCRKPLMTRMAARWNGFHIEGPVKISDSIDVKDFEACHKDMGSLSEMESVEDLEFGSLSMDIGSFFVSKIYSMGLEVGRFNPRTIKHFESASWKKDRASRIQEVLELEREIMDLDSYGKIYLKYSEEN